MRICGGVVASFVVAAAGVGRGDEPRPVPLPVPLTRPEMKQALEDLKGRTPRIPLPELSAEEKQKLGDRGVTYEGRLRYHYLAWADVRSGAGLSREPDPNMSLDYA